MYNEVMIDIETLSTKNNATILTIGAAVFTTDTTQECNIVDTLEVRISVLDSEKYGCDINAATVLWWMGQPNEARKSLTSKDAISLPAALERLTEFCDAARERSPKRELEVWGNDPTFDMVILENAYQAVDMRVPWKFWETRSQRTLQKLAYQLKDFDARKDFKREGTHHSAVDDAVHQAKLVNHLVKLLETK